LVPSGKIPRNSDLIAESPDLLDRRLVGDALQLFPGEVGGVHRGDQPDRGSSRIMMDQDSKGTVEAEESPLGRSGTVGFVCGVVTGTAAGLIGVGGGEFRIPVLLHVLRLPVKVAAGVNMVIGLFTVALSLARRWGHLPWTHDALALGAVMGTASLLGSVLGARQAHKFSSPFLKRVVCIYLAVVGVWMVVEAIAHAEYVILEPHGPARWVLAGLVGFAVAVVSGSLGVAGGEMRIPALMYLFGIPIKEAGTISLLVSIPTVAAGAFTYRRLGHLPNRAIAVALLMGVGSLLGVVLGASLLASVDKHTIKGLLGVILLLATIVTASSKKVHG
jgi:uncharacterized membrane protein YfcA